MEKFWENTDYRDWLRRMFLAVQDGTVRDAIGQRNKRELLQFSERVHSFLGNKKKVVICANNSVNWLGVFLSCILHGRELYAFHNDIKDDDLIARINVINPDILITNKTGLLVGNSTYTLAIDDLENIINREAVDQTIESKTLAHVILYTTGTTGVPKGVKLSLENIVYELMALQNSFRITDKDTILLASPFSHAMGFVMMLLALFFAKNAVVSTNQFETVNELLSHGADVVAIPPSLINILKKSDRFLQVASQMRFIISGGAIAPDEKSRMELANKGINIVNGYGMTEAVAAIATENPYDNKQDDYLTPLCCCEIKLSPESEVLVRGKNVADCYLDGSPITDSDGWYHTNDLGLMRNGRVKILSRKDSIIVMSNGYKINIDNMENRICQVEGILDARVFITNGDVEQLCVEVLTDEKDPNTHILLDRINCVLEYFEKVKILYVVKELKLNGGKKLRG